jgi:hypothetical protein
MDEEGLLPHDDAHDDLWLQFMVLLVVYGVVSKRIARSLFVWRERERLVISSIIEPPCESK